MRYLFTLTIIGIVWLMIVLIAASHALSTHDRLVLYLCVMALTLGLYKIGFARK